VNEVTVEIGETEEGLNIFDLPRFGPIPNCLDFLFRHHKSFDQKHIGEELHRILVQFEFMLWHRDCIAEDIIKLHGHVPCAEMGYWNKSRCH
jgi:hypothetical protein